MANLKLVAGSEKFNDETFEGMQVLYDAEAKKLHIVLDLSSKGRPSGSGKSMVFASTHGNQAIRLNGESVSVGVNAYRKTK
jgi:hypothetical protein